MTPGRHLIRGSAWMIGARWTTRLVGLASTVILARLLTPTDFGIVAMALIVAGLLETIAYAGVDLALMRAGHDTREHYDTAWTVQVIQASLIALLLLVAAPLAAAYFAEPRAEGVIQLLALKAFLDGLQNIGVVAFRKELDFAKEFRFMLYGKLLNFVVVVSIAFLLRNYWALALGMVAGSLIGIGLSYAMHPYRPRFSLARAREIWSFSQWLMISRVGAYLNRRTDEFVVGGIVGTTAMGSYHVASELSTMPSTELVMPMRRAMFPTLAKLTGDPAAFGAAVVATFATVAAVCIAAGFGLFAIAPELVRVLLGEQWLAAIPLVRWLALYGSFSALVLVLEVPLWVSGRTRWSAMQTWLELALLVPLVWLATLSHGIEGAAATRAAVCAAMVPFMFYLTVRAGHARIGALLGALARPLAAGTAMVAALATLPLQRLEYTIAILAAKIVVGAIAYALAMAALWLAQGRPDGFEATVLRHARALLARRR